jgi:hypothetical protein
MTTKSETEVVRCLDYADAVRLVTGAASVLTWEGRLNGCDVAELTAAIAIVRASV